MATPARPAGWVLGHIAVLLPQVLVVPDLVVLRAVVERQLCALAAEVDDARDGFTVGVMELGAVRGNK